MTEHSGFGEKLAQHSAPTLLGIKCANLISMSAAQQEIAMEAARFNRLAQGRGLRSRILCSCKNRTLLLVYNVKQLTARLEDPDVQMLLRNWGYTDFTLRACLDRLAVRMKNGGDFPHEIGIFLGYPLEDVVGFIENKGENFKLCGCWKVYGCEKTARRTFANYEKCRNFLCNKLNEGSDIYQALRLS